MRPSSPPRRASTRVSGPGRVAGQRQPWSRSRLSAAVLISADHGRAPASVSTVPLPMVTSTNALARVVRPRPSYTSRRSTSPLSRSSQNRAASGAVAGAPGRRAATTSTVRPATSSSPTTDSE